MCCPTILSLTWLSPRSLPVCWSVRRMTKLSSLSLNKEWVWVISIRDFTYPLHTLPLVCMMYSADLNYLFFLNIFLNRVNTWFASIRWTARPTSTVWLPLEPFLPFTKRYFWTHSYTWVMRHASECWRLQSDWLFRLHFHAYTLPYTSFQLENQLRRHDSVGFSVQNPIAGF